jgi:hypothetical protein
MPLQFPKRLSEASGLKRSTPAFQTLMTQTLCALHPKSPINSLDGRLYFHSALAAIFYRFVQV